MQAAFALGLTPLPTQSAGLLAATRGRLHSIKEGKLHLQLPDLDAAGYPYQAILDPLSLRNYILWVDGYPLQLTILLDDQGKAEYLRTRIAVGARVEPDAPPQRLTINLTQLRRLLRLPRAPLLPWFL